MLIKIKNPIAVLLDVLTYGVITLIVGTLVLFVSFLFPMASATSGLLFGIGVCGQLIGGVACGVAYTALKRHCEKNPVGGVS